MTSKFFLSPLLLLLTLAMCVQPAALHATADENTLGTPVTSLPYTITSPGVYRVMADLSNPAQSGTAITVNADDVVLDLNGHHLTNANSAGTAEGVKASDHHNVTVRNGTLQGFGVGVYLASASAGGGGPSYGNLVEEVTVSGATWAGIRVFGDANVIRRCEVGNTGGIVYNGDGTGYGIIVQNGVGSRVLDNDVDRVKAVNGTFASFGILLSSTTDCLVASNRVSGMAYGIYFNPNSTGKYGKNLAGASVGRAYFCGTDAGGNIVDSNGNGVDDDWEQRYFGNLSTNVNALSAAGDGYTILQEYQLGRNPLDYYQGVTPGFQISTGNNQRGTAGTVLLRPLVTQVTVPGTTTAQANAPVTYQVITGGALVAVSGAGPWAASCAVRTNASGQATVYCRMPTAGGLGSSIQASAGSATPLVFNEYVLPPVAAGANHTLAVDPNGAVWSWGYNNYGQLGNGTLGDRSFADRVPVFASGMVAVAAGSSHSLALRGSDGGVWAWGYNNSGQLGTNSTANSALPAPVLALGAGGPTVLTGVVALAAGSSHSLALKGDGSVWAWGSNVSGQLGDGTTTQRLLAVQVFGPGSGVVALTAGYGHSVALKADGTVWAWGYNGNNQLGGGSSASNSSMAVEVKLNASSYLTSVVAVASGAGAYHTLAIRADGTLWAWGSNYEGQLGINSESGTPGYPVQVVGVGAPHSSPTTASLGYLGGVVGVAAGVYHSLAVLNDGRVCAWGYNGSGQLGTNTPGDTGGDSDYPEVVVSTNGNGALGGVASVSAGGYHSAAVLNYRGVPIFLGWGSDSFGEVEGQVSTTTRPFPVLVKVAADADLDGSTDWQEYLRGMDPLNPSSNGNGVLDGVTLEAGVNPINLAPGLPAVATNDHIPPLITITFPTVGVVQQ